MPQRKILPKGIGDDDTEGHARRQVKLTGDDDDTEGHARRQVKLTGDDDDTEGHRRRPAGETGDDTEGHRRRPAGATGDDEDTEGQSMLSNPLLNRQLASAREQEIQRNLRERQRADEAARRPYNKRGRA
jgi:hypothetical protein